MESFAVKADDKKKSRKARSDMQDWTLFPLYLSANAWQKVMDRSVRSLQCVDCIISELHALGLRHPSEPTQATLCGLLVHREEPDMRQKLGESADQLRSLYLTVKNCVQSRLQKLKFGEDTLNGDEYVTELPSEIASCPPGLKAKIGAELVPPKIELMDIFRIAKTVCMRGNRSKGQHTTNTMTLLDGNSIEGQWQRMMMFVAAMNGNVCGSKLHAGSSLTLLEQPKKGLPGLLDRASSTESLPSPAPALLALANTPANEAFENKAKTEALANTPANEAFENKAKTEAAAQSPDATEMDGEPGKMEPGLNAQPPLPTDHLKKDEPECTKPANQLRRNSLSLMESIGRFREAKDAKTEIGGPSTGESKAKAKSKAVKSKTKPVLKRPSAQKVVKRKVVTGKDKQDFLKGIPKNVLQKFKNGCGRCRNAPFCTYTCWKKRGW